MLVDRVLAEGVVDFYRLQEHVLCDVNSALDLLARHIVDQRASNLLFGDRRRLQEDLLADAASKEVRKLFPKRRGCPGGARRRGQ